MTDPVAAQLRSLLNSVSDRIDAERRFDVGDYISHSEWELAVEILADSLYESDATLTTEERAQFQRILRAIGGVSHDLSFLRLDG